MIPDTSIAKIEKNFQIIRISVGTRPPNRVLTVSLSDIKKYAERVPELTETLKRFNNWSILLSPSFADMLGVGRGDKSILKPRLRRTFLSWPVSREKLDSILPQEVTVSKKHLRLSVTKMPIYCPANMKNRVFNWCCGISSI